MEFHENYGNIDQNFLKKSKEIISFLKEASCYNQVDNNKKKLNENTLPEIKNNEDLQRILSEFGIKKYSDVNKPTESIKEYTTYMKNVKELTGLSITEIDDDKVKFVFKQLIVDSPDLTAWILFNFSSGLIEESYPKTTSLDNLELEGFHFFQFLQRVRKVLKQELLKELTCNNFR